MICGDNDAPWLSGDEREAWLAVAALAVKLPAALDAQLQADHGLSFFEYMVLAMLSEQDERALQMSELAEVTSASLSRLSHAARRLEGQGFIRRERVPGSGRRTVALLTDAGQAKVEAAAPEHVRTARSLVIDVVSVEDLAALGRVGRAVLGQIDGSATDRA